MKTKRMISLIAFAVFSLLTITAASANSAQKQWSGLHSTGAVVTDADCPIIVESELLTFDIPDFPSSYGSNNDYSANVTAQYSFYNPADYTVTATLAFPFGKSPDYSRGAGYADKYDITVNGSAIEKTVRHTIPTYGNSFSLENDLPRIVDGYKKDRFYYPELTVKKYTVEIIDYDKSYKNAGIGFDFSFYGNYKVIMSYNSDTPIPDGHRLGVHIGSKESITFYILGTQDLPKYRFYEDGGCETGEEISGEAKIVSAEEMTFEDLVFEKYPEDSAVLKSDWYNAVVDKLNSYYSDTLSLSAFDVTYSLMRWYEYEIELAPKERIVNTVTAPMYPSIDEDYNPYVYKYTYLLSPAQSWAKFGTLDIVINTPYHLIENEEFEKTDSGYQLSLSGLPDGELKFMLSSSEKPKKSIGFWDVVSAMVSSAPIFLFGVMILMGIVVVVVLVLWKKLK